MKDKMERAASFFKRGRTGGEKDIPDVPLSNSRTEKDNGEAGTARMEKAISFFKQRRGGKRGTQTEETFRSREQQEGHRTSLPSSGGAKGDQDRNDKPAGESAHLSFPHSQTPPGGADISSDGRSQSVNADELSEVPLQSSPRETVEVLLQDSLEEKERKKAGWISPTYSQSRAIHLDPGHMAQNRCLAFLDNVPEAEAYRVLRTQVLQRTLQSGSNTIMVTSALPGEGKTLTAINLAFTIAREFRHTVLLVDGDLKKQSIHKYLGCTGEKGLIDYLVDGLPVSELITWPGIEKMTLMSGGRSFHESAEILGSPRMKELIYDMKGRYTERYIIFDVPSILTGADVLTFASLVELVIVVVQAGKTSMDDVKKAVQFLPKDKILGFVLNRCQPL